MSATGGQHAQALVVSVANAAAFEAGLFDWLADTGEKVLVAFLIAVVSGLGYQVGRLAWRRLGGRG